VSATPGGAPRPLSPSTQKVQEAIAALGLPNRVFELEQPVRTAAEAAAAVGCDVRQIAKSIVFMTATSKRPVLVVTSGANRVNEEKMATMVGEPLARAPASFVRDQTGFAIGGVPPLGHERPVRTVVDSSLRRFETVWCAGGTPHAVFPVETEALIAAVPGADVREVS
jgi:prolyl-tRNA editing enzyme YbaK/EbsC (Cys-tRNA(Pro) deacylase)